MKKVLSLIMVTVMLFVFSGCGDETLSFIESEQSILLSSNSETVSDSYPTFYSVTDLRDYLNSQKDNNRLDINFYYKGRDEITPMMLAQMTSCLYATYSIEGELHNLKITEYPGDHIVDAYFSGDDSSLTEDEKKVMSKAIQMLSTAKSKAADEWELELLIHDALAEHITYYTEDYDTSDADTPRFLTAIGAILDKKANCQGYTDAFYMLASMAGFKVGRMNVETKDDLHTTNTILLNGSWYVVDVTFDDQEGDAPINYRLFNAGMDQINEYTWEPFKEIHKIAAFSGKDSYYIHNNIVFNTVDDFVHHIKNQFVNGEKTMQGVVRKLTDADSIKNTLETAFSDLGASYSYTYWYCPDGKDVYYTIFFS